MKEQLVGHFGTQVSVIGWKTLQCSGGCMRSFIFNRLMNMLTIWSDNG